MCKLFSFFFHDCCHFCYYCYHYYIVNEKLGNWEMFSFFFFLSFFLNTIIDVFKTLGSSLKREKKKKNFFC
jgi:hypothetical protein